MIYFQIILSSTLEIYNKAVKNFLPSPSRSHYVFNLRDFARVVQVKHFFYAVVTLMVAHDKTKHFSFKNLSSMNNDKELFLTPLFCEKLKNC